MTQTIQMCKTDVLRIHLLLSSFLSLEAEHKDATQGRMDGSLGETQFCWVHDSSQFLCVQQITQNRNRKTVSITHLRKKHRLKTFCGNFFTNQLKRKSNVFENTESSRNMNICFGYKYTVFLPFGNKKSFFYLI